MADKSVTNLIEAITEAKESGTKAYDTNATVVRIEGTTAWVHIVGGVDETPAQMTINANPGDVVKVRVSGGRAYIIGNATAPPTDDSTAIIAEVKASFAHDNAVQAKNAAESAEAVAVEAAESVGNKLDTDLSNLSETVSETDANRVVTSSSYIEEEDGDLMIGDKNQTGSAKAVIKDESFDIEKNGKTVASFGEETVIGEDGGSRFVQNNIGIKGVVNVEGQDETYFEVQNDMNEHGVSVVTDTFIANSGDSFRLSRRATKITSVRIDGIATTDYSLNIIGTNVTISETIPQNAEIKIKYETLESGISYTFGKKQDDETPGIYGFAEGFETKATGKYSHAEGFNTGAYGTGAHVEGIDTMAYGRYSHAEGQNTQTKQECSHAEGFGTIAASDYSHAEGKNTLANGECCHAEGIDTVAGGLYSHAGGQGTIAKGVGQYVIGKYNVETVGKVFIVGDGSSDTDRHNAFSIDVDGTVYSNGHSRPIGHSDSVTLSGSKTVNNNAVTIASKTLSPGVFVVTGSVAWASVSSAMSRQIQLDTTKSTAASGESTQRHYGSGQITQSTSRIFVIEETTTVYLNAWAGASTTINSGMLRFVRIA